GIVNVSAKDLGTGKEQKITITASSGLAEEEINKMVKDAEAHAAEDKKRREEIDIKNQADTLIYSTEKTLNENRDKLGEEDIKTLENALKEAKEAHSSGNIEKIKETMENLENASHKLAETMYQKAQSQQQQAPPGGQQKQEGPQTKPGGDDNVVDAEFEDTDK
ncbi:MAG TPA: Hsp70 family protein, partial [Nitrospinota bacterium]|nr:Hsp70 family protein [Nitrospinota bacterium]